MVPRTTRDLHSVLGHLHDLGPRRHSLTDDPEHQARPLRILLGRSVQCRRIRVNQHSLSRHSMYPRQTLLSHLSLQFNSNLSFSNPFQILVLPVILSKPEDTVVEANASASFKISLQTSDLPQAIQLCDKSLQPLNTDSPKYQLISHDTESTYTYSVNECSVQDAGDYHFIVSNKFGKVTCSAKLLVKCNLACQVDHLHLERSQLTINSIFLAPPLILGPLKDTEVVEGTSLELVTQLSACYPIPQFEWFKEGTRVEESDRCQLQVAGSDYKLTVLNACQSDEAEYLFKSFNDLGSIETSCQACVFGISRYYIYSTTCLLFSCIRKESITVIIRDGYYWGQLYFSGKAKIGNLILSF